ncbi:MAG: hypothetical protein KDA32_08630 [Phycisphaerales bacterium]|nr:hypothetical protein [Phycisphaerales bacterium]
MAIQFACKNCDAMIEVDEDMAGRAVTCPYCERVTTAPDEPVETTRPVLEAPPLAPQTVASIQAVRESAVRRYGVFGAICAVFAAACLLTAVFILLPIMLKAPSEMREDPEQMQRFLIEKLSGSPMQGVPFAAAVGMVFFSLAGLTLGVISLTQSGGKDWAGWIATIVAGGLVLMFCGSLALAASGFGPAGP